MTHDPDDLERWERGEWPCYLCGKPIVEREEAGFDGVTSCCVPCADAAARDERETRKEAWRNR